MNYVINLFASMKLKKGHKNYLALDLKLWYTIIFYELGWNIIWNGGLNIKLLFSGKDCLVDLFCLGILFTT